MPASSKAQYRYFQENRKQLESQGVDVDDYLSVDLKDLPERVKGGKAHKNIDAISKAVRQLNKKYK